MHSVTQHSRLYLGTCAFGRAIDAGGAPLDGGATLRGRSVSLELRSPKPNERAAIDSPLWTGIRVLDGLLTTGRGARVGIFGPPGSGKTTLLEWLVDGCEADAVVVALVGERGREAQHWIARCDERTTIVCATGDRPPAERLVAAYVATAQARALRERGLHVLLVIDSLARVAAAAREIAVGLGESTGRGGYPPSVFAELARIVEVAGAVSCGSITLVASVLSDGDERDPVSDAARSLLDGHIALSAQLAGAGRFPAVDVLGSASRTMQTVSSEAHQAHARSVRHILALLDRTRDARSLGIEPVEGTERAAIALESSIESFLRQRGCRCDRNETLSKLAELGEAAESGNADL
jgi:FliI/YscN family ATPase